MITYQGKIEPLKNDVLVINMERGVRKTRGGIILADDDVLKEENIKPRWAQVWKLGEKVDLPLKVGEWILIDHGRWSRRIRLETPDEGVVEFQKVDPKDILLVSEHCPFEGERPELEKI